MTKFTLSTYLMLSVAVILSGIAWVILSQNSDRYSSMDDFSELKAEQDEILRQYYQLQEKYLPKKKQTEPLHKVLSAQLMPSISGNTANRVDQPGQNVAAQNNAMHANVDNGFVPESNDFLRNNPWSPDYQPGY